MIIECPIQECFAIYIVDGDPFGIERVDIPDVGKQEKQVLSSDSMRRGGGR